MRLLISLCRTSNPQDSPGLASKSRFEAWHHAGSHCRGFSEPSALLWSQKKADGWFAHAGGRGKPRLQQSIGKPACFGSAFTSHQVMKAMPLLTKTAWDVCFPAGWCSLMKLFYVQRWLSSTQESRCWSVYLEPVGLGEMIDLPSTKPAVLVTICTYPS